MHCMGRMGCMGCMGCANWPAWPEFCCCQLDEKQTEMAIPLECAVSRDTGTRLSDYVNYQMCTSINNKHPYLINGHITMMVLGMRWIARPGTPSLSASGSPESTTHCGEHRSCRVHPEEHGELRKTQMACQRTRTSRCHTARGNTGISARPLAIHWREDSTRP